MKLSSVGMAGSTPLLQLTFKDVPLADTSMATLWEQVQVHAHMHHFLAEVLHVLYYPAPLPPHRLQQAMWMHAERGHGAL